MSPAGVPGADAPDAGNDGVDGDPSPRFCPVCFVLDKQTGDSKNTLLRLS